MSLDEASAILKRDEDQHFRTNIDFIQLKVSQASAVEQFDEQLASQFEERGSNDIVQMNSTPSNDGTNACAFLSVAVADVIFMLDKGDEFFTCLAESVEQTIWFLPEKITRTAMLRKTTMPWRHTEFYRAYISLRLHTSCMKNCLLPMGSILLLAGKNYIPNCAVSVATTSLLFLPLILWF